MINNKGSVPIVAVISIVLIACIVLSLDLMMSEKANNMIMLRRVESRYEAESLIDIQRHLLKNKLDNTVIDLFYSENNNGGFLLQSGYLFDPSVINTGFSDIDSEADAFIQNQNLVPRIQNESSNLILINENKDDLRITSLCEEANFWIDNNTQETYIGDIKPLEFESTINYLGGKIVETFRVTGLQIFRYKFPPLQNGETVGHTTAAILTENMKITVESFENYTSH